MPDSLLQSWLEHYDPIHRGWTPAGIANGVCTMNGFAFPRIRGGYNLRRIPGGQSMAEVVGAAGASASTVRTFPWVAHSPGADYEYVLTAISGGGCENITAASSVMIAIDPLGNWAGPRPNAPTDLRVVPAKGGRFLIQWVYDEDGQQIDPSGFRLYRGTGWSGVSYAGPVAVVAHQAGQVHFSYISEECIHGTRVTWAVRAVSAAGVEEDNGRTVTAWAVALSPPINPVTVVRRV
jgi:hypothetical protein